jgi:hypothetical protein
LICKLCSLAFREGYTGGINVADHRKNGSSYQFPNWNNFLTRLTGKLLGYEDLYFAPVTVEILAARNRQYVSAISTVIGNYGPVITASLENLPQPSRHTLALGVIAAKDSLKELCELVFDMSPFVTQVLVVIDSKDVRDATNVKDEIAKYFSDARVPDLRVVAHPLDNDFAAQRNRVQEMAEAEWVIQLDTDERLTRATRKILPQIVAAAVLRGWPVVGFARRNMVDGVMADLYPDTQYRLLPAVRRFTRAVHEYPLLKTGELSFPYLGAEILHALASERLRIRELRYEGIMAGAAREDDTSRLRTAFRADYELPSLEN